jgi:hypothetical protein
MIFAYPHMAQELESQTLSEKTMVTVKAGILPTVFIAVIATTITATNFVNNFSHRQEQMEMQATQSLQAVRVELETKVSASNATILLSVEANQRAIQANQATIEAIQKAVQLAAEDRFKGDDFDAWLRDLKVSNRGKDIVIPERFHKSF